MQIASGCKACCLVWRLLITSGTRVRTYKCGQDEGWVFEFYVAVSRSTQTQHDG